MVVTDIATIELNNNVNPIKQTISGFALGPYGWLEKIGMISVAISFLLIASALLEMKKGAESNILKLGGFLFIIMAFGFLMTSLFDTHVFGTPNNIHGFIHLASLGVVCGAFYLSCLIFARLLMGRPGLRFLGVYSLITFFIPIIVLSPFVFLHDINNIMGMLEQVITGFNLLWIVAIGPQLIKTL